MNEEYQFLKDLNKDQLKAATTLHGPVLIQAGAGSGKTKTVIARIQNLIAHGVAPFHILAITFTNKAASELKDRLPANAKGVMASTIHSLCARILRMYPHLAPYTRDFTIIDDDDQKKIIKMAINDYLENDAVLRNLSKESYKERASEIKHLKLKTFISYISLSKKLDYFNTSQSEEIWQIQKFMKNNKVENYANVYAAVDKYYHRYCLNCDSMDFDDLLYNTVRLLKNNPKDLKSLQEQYQYISVDEYQDTSTVQEEMINMLANTPEENLCVVGDPNQSIYAFRGAKVTNILNFAKKHPKAKIVSIMYNYRSTQSILNAANDVINKNPTLLTDEDLTAVKPDGAKPKIIKTDNDYDEAQYVAQKIVALHKKGEAYKDIAVLYRINSLSRLIEQEMVKYGIPYTIIGSLSFYERMEIRDLIAYLRLINNSADDLAFNRIVNTPARRIGTKTINLLQVWAKAQTPNVSNFVCAENAEQIEDQNHKPLSNATIKNLKKFTDYINSFNGASLLKYNGVYDVLKQICDDFYIAYVTQLDQTDSRKDTSRLDNVAQLLSAAKTYDAQHTNETLKQRISGFIENATLGAVNKNDAGDDQVQLMTVHASKGLEFDTVFIIGLEDEIFPSPHVSMTKDRNEAAKLMYEERRLMYVAITRAKLRLYMTYASSRLIWGQDKQSNASQFLSEIKDSHVLRTHFTPKIGYDNSQDLHATQVSNNLLF